MLFEHLSPIVPGADVASIYLHQFVGSRSALLLHFKSFSML